MGRPRATPQHAVILTEEHLRILTVGVRHEPRVAIEVRRRPLPHTPDASELPAARWLTVRLLGPGQRLLPLCLGWQSRVVCTREGIGLEPGDVTNRRLRVAARRRRMMRDVVLLLPRPTLARPPLA